MSEAQKANDELRTTIQALEINQIVDDNKFPGTSKRDDEVERIRKTMAQQLGEFDTMKKKLMRDLQNRCEKVVELEISLDETREQVNFFSYIHILRYSVILIISLLNLVENSEDTKTEASLILVVPKITTSV